MGTKRRCVAAIGVVVIAAASACVGWAFNQPSADSSVEDLLQDRITYFDVDDIDGIWSVGSGSFAGYAVDETLRGLNATVRGRTDSVSGQIDITDAHLVSATIECNLADVHSNLKVRDDYFSHDVIDTEAYPTATFRTNEPVDLGELLEDTSAEMDQNALEVVIPGEVELNGKVVAAEANAEAVVTPHGIQVNGSVPLVWSDFGVTPPETDIVSVADSGTLEFLLLLNR